MDCESMDLLEDDVEVLEILEMGVPRQLNERREYLYSFDELSFYKRFRLTKNITMIVLEKIENLLECPLNRNNSIAPINQLLVSLRFFATGNHLLSIADFGGMQVSTVLRIVLRVSTAIAMLAGDYIKFPETTVDILRTKLEFFEVASFPNVIGPIDGTHVEIQSHGRLDGEVFRNRKNYFCVNVQAIGNAEMIFTNVVARWPGSTHDATISYNSRVRNVLEGDLTTNPNGFILGDSAYPEKPYLMTPLLNPRTTAEQLYNESQIRSRGVIERAFGIVKRRCPVFAYGVRLKLSTALTIIVATCVLHNVMRSYGILDASASFDFIEEDLQNAIANGQISEENNNNLRSSHSGMQKRTDLINNYFNRL